MVKIRLIQSFESLYPIIKQYLEIIGSPNCNNADLANASKALKECFKQVHAIPALIQIISEHENAAVRQLASVEVRKLIQKDDGQFWESLDVNSREAIKANLLQMAVNEQSQLVRHSLAHVISETAKNELNNERWGNLIDILYESSASADVRHRELCVYVLYSCFEFVADLMEAYIPRLMSLFMNTINDQESLLVRVTTCQALGKIADFVQEDDKAAIEAFQNQIPAIVAVLQKCLEVSDDDGCSKIFEVFDELLLLEAPLLKKHFGDLVNLFLGIASNQEHSEDIRSQAISFLIWCIMSAKSKIKKANLIPNIIDAMFTIAAEEEPENRDEDYPAKLAVQVINTLSTTFPPQAVFPIAMARAAQAIQSANPGDRKAAMLSVAVMVEGCADYMRPNLNEILEFVVRSMQDSDARVRVSACMALGSLIDDFETEVSEKHSVILPVLFNLLNDPDPSIYPEALSTLDTLLETLGKDIMQYVPTVMNKLVSLWGSGTQKVQITTTNCIGSVAFAAAEEFRPYFDEVLNKLVILLSLTDSKDLALRSAATDCVGAVATAVGADLFRPHLNKVMEMVVAGMQYDSSHLKQCSYVLFGVLGKLFGDEFAPYLQVIVPPIMQSCTLAENEFGQLEEEFEEEQEMGQEPEAPTFASAVAQEKESSIDTLGELFAATKGAFMPYVPDSINITLSLLDHYHDGVRITAIATLLKFFNTAYEIGNTEEWTSGLPLKTPLHENVANIGKLAIEGVLALLSEEDERMVVTQGLQSLTETFKLAGPAALSQEFSGNAGGNLEGSHLDFLCNLLLKIFNGDHNCQLTEEGEAEEDEDMAELDALVITAASDTVSAICSAIGPQFAPYFEKFMPLIAKYYKKPSVADRSMAVGALAECVDGLEQAVAPFKAPLMELFMIGLTDVEDEVKSNSAFGAGLLCFHTKSTEFIPKLLQLLHPLFSAPTITNIRDNACGSLCRIIMTSPSQVPLDQALPAILNCLPLTKDNEENRPIYQVLLQLLKDGNQYLYANLSQITALICNGLKENAFHEVTKQEIRDFYQSVRQLRTDEFNALVNGVENSSFLVSLLQ